MALEDEIRKILTDRVGKINESIDAEDASGREIAFMNRELLIPLMDGFQAAILRLAKEIDQLRGENGQDHAAG